MEQGWSLWEDNALTAGLLTFALSLPLLYHFASYRSSKHPLQASIASDPGLLSRSSLYRAYKVGGFTYPSIRTFYRPHAQAAKFATDSKPFPLLVFIHGLGGSVAQFHRLLTSLINVAPCLAIDLPGCGLSDFEPRATTALTTEALASLVAEAIRQHCEENIDQKIVLIGHSYGCSIGALLASGTLSSSSDISRKVVGLIAMCPRTIPITERQISQMQYLRFMPAELMDMLRLIDARGRTESVSVMRFVGKEADAETKRLQWQYNQQSRSAVFLAMLAGMRPRKTASGYLGGLPGEEVWKAVRVPTFCIAGETDQVCPTSNLALLEQWLGTPTTHNAKAEPPMPVPAAAGIAMPGPDPSMEKEPSWNGIGPKIPDIALSHQEGNANDLPPFVFKSAIIPAPASHGLLYATSTARIVSGLIESFLSTAIDHQLSLGWQLQHLATEGKWDVKNLEKWKRVEPVSAPIAGIFRAMKTLREVDDEHTPKVFAKKWAVHSSDNDKAGVEDARIKVVVDLSHDSPVYDPKGLEDGSIAYHKFPTVSKMLPTSHEVKGFITLIDTLREGLSTTEDSEPVDESAKTSSSNTAVIGVHCHYGFNRTGFFVVSYLVIRCGYHLQEAIDLFAEKRPPGIRHDHFINELFVRFGIESSSREADA